MKSEKQKLPRQKALEQRKSFSEQTNAARNPTASHSAQEEAVRASGKETLKKLETTQEENDKLKTATQEGQKKAAVSDAAKKVDTFVGDVIIYGLNINQIVTGHW
ncbi:unnamed protein product [Brassica oleracea var. botrytis]|uniref:Uncharacterized protein n=1 Tax=Brassica oleracea TaxID=3712 RepID=A0A3P6DDH5_BRAOL|nr:unnamed protein product [Brassica oleracea]